MYSLALSVTKANFILQHYSSAKADNFAVLTATKLIIAADVAIAKVGYYSFFITLFIFEQT